MDGKHCRFNLKLYWSNRQASYLEAATYANCVFRTLSSLDAIFESMIYVGSGREKDFQLDYNTSVDDVELANIMYGEHRFWLNKMYPDLIHDINCKNHYGISFIIKTKGKPLNVVKFDFGLGANDDTRFNGVFVEFPRGFIRDFEWYKKILSVMINVFKPDYGGLYPVVMVKHEPPPVTGGWVSYFAPKFKLGCNVFDGCVKIPVLDNEFMYAVEDNHMIQKNEVQFNKLGALTERFKILSIQL